MMSFGQTDGLHSVTFNGNNVMIGGVNRDSHVTISGLSFTAMMHPDNIGKWKLAGLYVNDPCNSGDLRRIRQGH